MKQVIMKKVLVAGIALLSVPAVFAQQKEKVKTEKDKIEKKSMQTIVITRNGDLDQKTVVEIDGDKVKVNGKDAKDNKDVNVHVNTFTSPNVYRVNGARAGQNFVWNDGDGFSLFSEDENRAMLGVTTEGDAKGAEIKSITKESAAEKAGLKAGDIITKIDDRKIESTDDVTEAIRSHKPGDKVAVSYLRDGKEQKATAELTKWKGVRMSGIAVPSIQSFGQMGDLNERWREIMPSENFTYAFGRPRLGLSIQDTEDGVGVKVLDVDDESPAAKAGIKEDDIILGVDDVDIKGTEDVVRATRGSKEKMSFNFKVKRGNSTQTIEVKIPRKLKTADL
jgi:serine protease Do